MEIESTTTNNSTDTAVEETPVVNETSVWDDPTEGLGDFGAAGAKDLTNTEAKPEEKQAVPGDKSAPAKAGTPDANAPKQQPVFVKGEVTPEIQKFFKDKGFYVDEKNQVVKLPEFYKSYTELEKMSTERNTLLAHRTAQLAQLQTAETEPKGEPLTKDAVKKKYGEGRQQYSALAGMLERLKSANVGQEDVAALSEWINSLGQDIQDEYEEGLETVRTAELEKKFGKVSDDSSTTIHQKANEVITPLLTKEEVADQGKLQKLFSGEMMNVFSGMAAMLYPRQFGKGTTPEETQKNTQDAIKKVMASNPELTKSLLTLGRSHGASAEFDQKLKDAEKASYDKGLADGLKGKRAGGTPSSKDTVKQSALGDDHDKQKKFLNSLTDDSGWGT